VGSKAHAELPDGVQEHYIGDDGNVHIPLQFPFPYYGRTFTDSWMFSNGVVGFLSPQTSFCCTGMDLSDPNYHSPTWNFALMPLWTDLRNYNGRFLTEGTEDYQRYVWENISEYGRPGSENTFGVEIFPSGDWRFYHEKIDISRPFTIGATGDLSLGEYQQFQYYPQGLQDYNYGYQWDSANPWTPTYNGDPNPVNICDADPLADPSCPGYADAYYEQQCSFDPLYDPTCPGYDQAYLDLQCAYDPLYDTTCNGYAEAYYEQQCSLDPLYDTGCNGYAEAYYNQQCSLDPLYDRNCEGYDEAYAQEYILNEDTTTDSETQVSTTQTETVPITDPEEIGRPSATGDSTIDSILGDLNDLPDTSVGMEDQTMATVEVETEVEETIEEPAQEEQVEEELVALEVESDQTESESNDSESTADTESDGGDAESSGESEREVADGGDSDAEKKNARREKI